MNALLDGNSEVLFSGHIVKRIKANNALGILTVQTLGMSLFRSIANDWYQRVCRMTADGRSEGTHV
jgi:hypothetical protein